MQLKLVLPVGQTALAAALLLFAGPTGGYIATSRLICWGLNAPALLFMLPLGWQAVSRSLPRNVFGIPIDDLLFLMGTGFLWYLVGNWLDQRRSVEARDIKMMRWVPHFIILSIGGLLLYLGFLDFQQPRFSNLGNRPYRGILYVLWACTLLYGSGRGMTRLLQTKAANRREEPS